MFKNGQIHVVSKLFPKGLIHIHNTTLYTASDSVYELHELHVGLGIH